MELACILLINIRIRCTLIVHVEGILVTKSLMFCSPPPTERTIKINMPPTGIYHTELHNHPLAKKPPKTKQRETKRQENEETITVSSDF